MRYLVLIAGTMLFVGCGTQSFTRDDAAGIGDLAQRRVKAQIEQYHVEIGNSLETRTTIEDAPYQLLPGVLRDGQSPAGTAADNHGTRAELDFILKRLRSQLEPLWSRVLPGDELWVYRAYLTADKRGGERGVAIVRNGRVVDHMGIFIID